MKPARLLSKPTVQNQVKKIMADVTMLSGISTMIWAVTRAVQLYMRLGRSRIS